ncbi:MAG: hypothetical protein A2X45_18330 [Lentisphaerae bacterium GWF2_50_93]|nr:MAG: hypothetical protein A2X45_18330 [Lentisphaerae bacterium GWF2_50_93]
MSKIKIPIFADIAVILLVSLAALSGLILSGSWPQSHDGLRYLCHLDQFRDAFNSGVLYPRWMPNYYGGYGYPIFLFYQPGYFFLSLLFTFFTSDILAASYASNVAMFFIGGTGVYLLVMKIAGDRLASLFSSIMFLLTPYVYVNLFVRGDLSELLAMFVVPWPLYFLLRLKDRITGNTALAPSMLVLSLMLAAVVYSHPFTAMFFYPLFCVFMLPMCLDMDRKQALKFLGAGSTALLCAVIFSSPYWFTAFQMKKYVDYNPAVSGFYSAENHIVYFQQLFSRFWGFLGSEPGISDGMSFQLGLPHFILAVAGFWLNRRSKFFITAFSLYILCIVMMTPAASLLWKNIPLMNFVQFPWRLLSVIVLLQILCISGIWKLRGVLESNVRFCSALVAFLLLTLLWNANEFQFIRFKYVIRDAIEFHRQLRLEKMEVYESFNEFVPKTATSYLPSAARGNGPMLSVSDPACRISEYPESNPHHMRYSVSSERPQVIMVNQLYFPGWKIILGDKDIDGSTLLEDISKDGRIQIEIPAGENQYLEAFYEGPPGWYARNVFIGIVFLAMLVAIMLEHRKILKETGS